MLDHRGFVLAPELRALVDGERSLERLRAWLRRALGAARVEDVFGA